MSKQLFLFNNSDEKRKEEMLPADTELPADENVIYNEEDFFIAEEEQRTLPDTQDQNVSDPFADIQQQRQNEIDYKLLLPNKKRGRKSFKDMDEEAILIEVPEDDVLFQKRYYPTRIVAEWFGITQSQLRAWENEFDVLQPKKNRKGDRFFRPEDVKTLKLIYHLIRIRKFTVQGAKQYLEDNRRMGQKTMQLTESLQKFKQFLLELKAISG